MGRSRLEVLSILIFHQHLLHTRQSLPSSSSCISSGSGLADCRAFLSDAPASHHRQEITKQLGPFPPWELPSSSLLQTLPPPFAFLPFPGSAGYRSDLLQSISLWDEEGFSSCSTCPCHRAVPTTPPECHVASVSPRHAMLPSPRTRELGLRIYFFSRPPVGLLSLLG